MTLKHLCLLLLAVIACTAAQSSDDIPIETDNQFPPDNHPDTDDTVIEGSGAGAITNPIDVTTESKVPLVEDVLLSAIADDEVPATNSHDSSCPKPCVCNIEGDTNNFVVDCSGYSLTEFPSPIDPKVTTLNIQNNKLTEIPKDISALKNLKVLNANNNALMELVSGSISELPELTVLKLGNNRLIEYPKDLKNSFGLTKLEELDLSGNDIRTTITPEILSNFKALRKLTLPTSTASLLDSLCTSLKESLHSVCTGTCDTEIYECPEAPDTIEDDMLDAVLPGTIAVSAANEDNFDEASIDSNTKTEGGDAVESGSVALNSIITDNIAPTVDSNKNVETGDVQKEDEVQKETTKVASPETTTSTAGSVAGENASPISEFSLRSAVIANKELEVVSQTSTPVDVAVGATTSDTKTGGVDKSIIGMIVAGMVLVVAGITIKKNWSSIKNKFSSSPRPANERTPANGNGTTPEEVPLQDKSPV